MHFIAILLVLLLSSAPLHAAQNNKNSQWLSDWEQQDSDDGIFTQCRQHKNKINQCKFTTVVDESFTALSAVIVDVDNFTAWAEGVLISEKMAPLDGIDDIFVYTTYRFPGAYDRYAVTRYLAEQNPETKAVRIKFKTVSKEAPTTDLRLVRYPLMAGYWQFKPLENGKTEIEHLSFVPPGGVVQKTLYYFYNKAYVSASFDTIRALTKQAKKDKYQNTVLDFIHTF